MDERFLELDEIFVIDHKELNDVFHYLKQQQGTLRIKLSLNKTNLMNNYIYNSNNDFHRILHHLTIQLNLFQHQIEPNDDKDHLEKNEIQIYE
jgi:hypothetical protein